MSAPCSHNSLKETVYQIHERWRGLPRKLFRLRLFPYPSTGINMPPSDSLGNAASSRRLAAKRRGDSTRLMLELFTGDGRPCFRNSFRRPTASSRVSSARQKTVLPDRRSHCSAWSMVLRSFQDSLFRASDWLCQRTDAFIDRTFAAKLKNSANAALGGRTSHGLPLIAGQLAEIAVRLFQSSAFMEFW